MSVDKYSKHQRSRKARHVATFPDGHVVSSHNKAEYTKLMDSYQAELDDQ